MNNWFKRNSTHLIIIGLFIALCLVYFSPAIQGKALIQNDVLQAKAMQKEIMDYKAIDGKAPLWTNSMFGGMPSYQIWVQYPYNITTYVISFFKSIFPNPIDTVLLYLLGAYLLFSVLRIKPWLAAAGAIAFAFSSYNFIIIEAGHSNKALAIAFFAPILAGIILTLRGRLLTGAALTAIALALEIRSNHIQMTYYLFIALLIFIGIEIYHAYKNKTLKELYRPAGYLVAALLIAVAVNAAMLWTTYEYGKESIRGKSNLSRISAEPSNGLDKEYAYQWSQGVGENITFLIPNFYGGGGVSSLDETSAVAKVLSEKGVPADQAVGFAKQLPTYWGEKPFTSGPFYFGAIICFLFILGLFIVPGRMKWWILSATLLSLLLSFGKNWPLISDVFFNYFPMYNKFRAVESILVIAGFLFPLLAILTVQELSESQQDAKKLFQKFKYTAFGMIWLLVVFSAIPDAFFSFKSSTHGALVDQLAQVTGGDRNFAETIAQALVKDRIDLAQADALRSLVFVLIAVALVWAILKRKLNITLASVFLAIAILVDLWGVDRRYLNNDNFVDPSALAQQFQQREVDQFILRDPSTDYRVLDLTIPTFSSATASYFHKTVGGYHAAKLKRYQEVIDKQFNGSINEDVLDMLNTKYVIINDPQSKSQKMQNRASACGNVWFVPKVTFVKDADEEMTAISSFNPRAEAFVGDEFKSLIDDKKVGFDPNGMIKLSNYRPDHLTYEYSTGKDMVAVFSEIWYDKGWKAYVDGEEIPYFRANYILRAAALPGGNHKLEFKFEPVSYYVGEYISLIASILLIASLSFAAYRGIKKEEA
ncbi:MAG: YfhO family protein [Sphingobacteriaceae bacterium]